MIAPGVHVARRQPTKIDDEAPRACCLKCGTEVVLAREFVSGTLLMFDTARPRDVFKLFTQGALDLGHEVGGYPDALREPVYREHRCREQ